MSINRRDFLRLAGVTGALFAAFKTKDVFSESNQNLALLDEISKSASIFTEKGPPITTLTDAAIEIKKAYENLPNLFFGRTMFADGTGGKGVWMGEKRDNYIPASGLKVAICNEILKTEPNLITPENMATILGKGDSSHELVMSTKIAHQLGGTQSEPVIRELLLGTGVELQSPPGENNLEVNFESYFKYLNNLKLPEVIATAMRQGLLDKDSNPFVSAILSKYINLDKVPVAFKIGISSLDYQSREITIVSYVFKSDSFTLLGYATGTNLVSADTQLLATTDVIGRYLQSKNQK